MRWSHLREVCGTIMSAAAALGVDVEDPRDQTESPFYASGPHAVTLAQNFAVDADAAVTSAFLTDGIGSYTPWTPPENWMRTLAEATDLVFVSDPDDCWCKHMWRVMPNGVGYTLEDTGSTGVFGCCPSIPVPQRGDVLDYSQNFIPAGWTENYIKGERTTARAARVIDIPKCVQMQGGVQLKETKVDRVLRLAAAQREMTGTLTWIIRPAHFQALYDLIKAVVEGSCGAKASVVMKHDTEEYLCEMAVPEMRDIIFSLRDSFEGYSDPGCLEIEGCDNIKLPWDGATCGATTCEGSGAQRVYCNTLEFLEALAGKLTTFLNAADFVNACGLACASTRTKALVQYKSTAEPATTGRYSWPEDPDNPSGYFIGDTWITELECPDSGDEHSRAVCYVEVGFGPIDIYTEVASATFEIARTTMSALIRSVLPGDTDADTLHCREQGYVQVARRDGATSSDEGQTVQLPFVNYSGPHAYACGSSTQKRCIPQVCLNASVPYTVATPLGLCGKEVQTLRNAAISMGNMLAYAFITGDSFTGALGYIEQSQIVRRTPGWTDLEYTAALLVCDDRREAGTYSRAYINNQADRFYSYYPVTYLVRGFCPKARSETDQVLQWYKSGLPAIPGGRPADICAAADSYAFEHAFENECP